MSMKQVLLILSVLPLFVCSCTDNNLSDNPGKKDNGEYSITFSLSKSDGDSNFNVTTKSVKGSVITSDYTVVFYLFKKNEADEFELVQKETVTPPLYTITGLDKTATYNYVFVTTKNENAVALDAIDFSSNVGLKPNTVPLPRTQATIGSLLKNCFIGYIEGDGIPTYAVTSNISEKITINNDLQIYGCGSLFLPGMTSSTPVDVIMERQFGAVEFVYTDAQVNDQLTCSFSTDYYRLYLSQMVRDNNMNYTSENFADIQAENSFKKMGINNYTAGDYYSALGILKMKATLPIITKTVTLNEGENSIRIYMPYTTAETAGTEVDNIYKANYIRFSGTGGPASAGIQGVKGSVVLSVTKANGDTRDYKREGTDAPFPIYRNAVTTFTTVGNDYMQISLGNGGIGLDDDVWDGD